MGMTLIYGLALLLIFSIIAISLFFYSRKKKSKIGLSVSIIMIVLIILALFTNTIDSFTISKKDIISDLSYIGIELKDDFEISSNKVRGIPERIQETKIRISQKDKNRIISEISSSTNFKTFANEKGLIRDTEPLITTNKILNFKYPEFYSRETYTKINNFTTRLFIKVYDNSNIVKYQKIED